jgi:hypothetical protein
VTAITFWRFFEHYAQTVFGPLSDGQGLSDNSGKGELVMKATLLMLCALALSGCTILTKITALDDAKKAKECFADAKATPEGQLVHQRIWSFDGANTADKLTDAKPLTPDERKALIQYKNRLEPCRKNVVSDAPYQELFQRQDQIFDKLGSGEMPVGLANKLSIESNGQFQLAVSKDHADAVSAEEAQQQRDAEAMLQASASQSRVKKPNCSWAGNNLNCTTIH